MQKDVLLILIGRRREAAVEVQKVLTTSGCSIKTRLGIHDGVLESCSDKGLIFLELVGDIAEHKALAVKLNGVKGVKAELVSLKLDDNA